MIARAQLIDILFVIVPHALVLDIAGPAEAFRLANQHREGRGLPPRFRLRFAGPVPSPATSVGLVLADLAPLPARLTAPTWVIVVGQPTVHTKQVTPAIIAAASWLRQRLAEPLRDPATPHRVVTICSGTLLAARAGITAGIDIALHLIAEECGEALAASVAEDMVVYLRRSPRDPELSPFHMHRRHLHATVHRVQDAIVTRPERDWDMAALAAVGNTTERHLLLLFVEHACVSPLNYLRSIRLERARQSLEYGASVSRAARVAGFRSDLQLRRAWRNQWGGSPRDATRASGQMAVD